MPGKIASAKSKPKSAQKPARKRDLIEPHAGDERYVRRKAQGQFGKTVNAGKSLSADSRTGAQKKLPKRQGDRGKTKH